MNERLKRLRALPRTELLKEVRRAADLSQHGEPLRKLVFWEAVAYGDTVDPVLAGPLTAQFLGVEVDDVVGYIVTNRVFDALSALAESVEQNDPPYIDPFRPNGRESKPGTEAQRVKHTRAP